MAELCRREDPHGGVTAMDVDAEGGVVAVGSQDGTVKRNKENNSVLDIE